MGKDKKTKKLKKKSSSSGDININSKDEAPHLHVEPRQPPSSFDPDGTHDIHRGLTNKELRAHRHELVKTLVEKSKKKKKGAADSSIYDDDHIAASIATTNSKLSNNKKNHLFAKDKVLAQKLENKHTRHVEAKIAAMDAAEILNTGAVGMLETEHDMERTTALTQVQLKRQLLAQDNDDDVMSHSNNTARHIYDLAMDSPHGIRYDRSGRFGLLFSSSINPQGHIAIMDCHTRALVPSGEFFVQENIRDACFLHHAGMLATASANNPVKIYDNAGAEIHSLADHLDALQLEFLPYHFLLASVGRSGFLKYTDTSTGQLVTQHRTRGMGGGAEPGLRAGQPVVMRQNSYNGVMHIGHTNGTVTLWSPASSKYLVKFLCHRGASVQSLAMDLAGRTMVTGGVDRQVKVWDLRNTYRELHSYFTVAGPPTSLDISQKGILGIGHAGHTTFWSASALKRKEKDPYMHHAIPGGGPIETLRFRPYEDVCGIGHAKGMSSIVIPGSGEPNLDTAEYHTNPFQDTKQRREAEVKALLDKLRPEMITLNPETIGGMEEADPHKRLERIRDKQEQANAKPGVVKKQKSKKRGRSKIQTKLRRKARNVVDAQVLQLREAREQEKSQEAAANAKPGAAPVETPKEQAPSALKRFFS